MFANHPRMAKRWAHHTESIKALPESKGSGAKDSEKKGEFLMNLEEKTIDAIQVAGAALDKAEKFYAEKRAEAQAVAGEIPSVVESLVARGMIEENEKEAAAHGLTNPLTAIKLLKRAAEFLDDTEKTAGFGQQVDQNGQAAKNGTTKRASVILGSEQSSYVGARTSGKKPSDLAFERGLGIG
jgi:hypothetical protein